MMFWVLAAVMAALLVLALLWPLLRARGAAPAAADYDRAVYRDQLSELELDLQRGLIGAGEAEAARREIERRLLQTEGGKVAAPSAGGPWFRRLALALVVALPPALGLGLYLQLGTPDLPGLPLAERDPGGPAELAMLIERLQARLADNPQDIEAQLVLAQLFERAGRFEAAAARYRAAIALIEQQGAVPAALHAALGEALVAAAGGQVGRDARLAFAAAIEADPGNSRARFFAGLAMAQDGRLQEAIAVWQDLAEDSPADAPWLPLLQQQIAWAARELGIEPPAMAQPQLPAEQPSAEQPPGPTSSDVEAAEEMTPQERTAFIRSMVDQLAARLEAEPADPDGWLRLARAHAVLLEDDNARAALARAEAEIAALPEGSPERAALTQRLEAQRRQLP
ncbi:MAG: c-type cytochrome biogenesis protein CcmI [Kiloniellaceae bacterium]